ncbi:MAG: hypothetical protein D6720_05695 [Gammaproteobacteria bacterium]|nr:MAG: hypothetical protein D6720_05695 [Gammaproteobacteria bacterium]
MPFARKLFKTLLVLAIAFVLLGLFLPDHASLQRQIVIDVPPQRVYAQIADLRAFHRWSPWRRNEGNGGWRFSDPSSGVGARMSWLSQDGTTELGSMELIRAEPPRLVAFRLQFGDKGDGLARFRLDPIDSGGTRVTWTFETAFGWDIFSRYVGLMLDRMLGPSYDAGLKALKASVERS